MGLITEQQLINRFESSLQKGWTNETYSSLITKASAFLKESEREQKMFSAIPKTYDIFLSHSSSDARLVAGLKLELEDRGYSVYIDWINDHQLDRTNVTKDNANTLRMRMTQCKSLLYAFSPNASTSTWMPWELGYFDGMKGLVAVAPIARSSSNSFTGNEYLGLYPYLDSASQDQGSEKKMWINEDSNTYVLFSEWLQGKKPFKRSQ